MVSQGLKPLLGLVMVGFVLGISTGSLMTGSNQVEAAAFGEQQIKRFSNACALSSTSGNQPKSCETVTH